MPAGKKTVAVTLWRRNLLPSYVIPSPAAGKRIAVFVSCCVWALKILKSSCYRHGAIASAFAMALHCQHNVGALMELTTRRGFARTAGWAAALSYGRIMGANDRVHMGFIGLGNRGDQVHQAFLEYGDAQTVAICDL